MSDSALNENSVALLSTTTVTFAAATVTTLYTVPAGKILFLDHLTIIGSADATTTTVTVGRSTALTDWLGTQTLSNIAAASDVVTLRPIQAATPVKEKAYVAAVIIQVDVSATGGGTTHKFKLYGTLYDA